CVSLSYVRLRRVRRSALFPYTTLFRSGAIVVHGDDGQFLRDRQFRQHMGDEELRRVGHRRIARKFLQMLGAGRGVGNDAEPAGRSEEHTSELQSRENLVCRLLLEKKNE